MHRCSGNVGSSYRGSITPPTSSASCSSPASQCPQINLRESNTRSPRREETSWCGYTCARAGRSACRTPSASEAQKELRSVTRPSGIASPAPLILSPLRTRSFRRGVGELPSRYQDCGQHAGGLIRSATGSRSRFRRVGGATSSTGGLRGQTKHTTAMGNVNHDRNKKNENPRSSTS